ncbi:GNAT family N-acetyltransferase [Rahnella laticis]|uniref:GNAT family N-acetyltransferase n=1 Tax=Rahnella laticis TaxID=2787622 RepID=UPI0018A30A24|nr:GNAT family N-acetyltransferase [Rahnella laticis]MBF7996533.1 GNAT family N-acetyltransferase [Rahnella laticis]
MLTQAPVLETERLILRGHRVEDFDDIAAQWADPAVVKYIGGTPSTREASWSRLLRYPGHWQMLGFGYWIVFEKHNGAERAFVGEIGLADYQRDITPSLNGMAEMGWVVSPKFHGKGYASEAAQAVLNWAGASLDRQLCCIIEPEHQASIRLAEKCGFVAQTDTTYHGAKTRIFIRR